MGDTVNLRSLLPVLGVLVSVTANAESTRDWGERALNIQASIDNDAPLSQTTWPGTHNSFANADDDNFLSDFMNQSMSVKDQLRAGIRQLVFDVHYDDDAPRVCHNNFAGGCVDGITGNQKLQNAIENIVEWINEGNQDQVVLLKLEMTNSAENNINKVRKKVDNFDSYYFQPKNTNYPNQNSKGCKNLPATLTKSEVLSAGKNIILYTDKCYSNTEYSNRVFNQGTMADFKDPDDVARDGGAIIARAKDGAVKGGVFYSNDSVKLKPSTVEGFLSAGLNIFETYGFGAEGSAWKAEGEYPVAPQDLVWSWKEGWPSTSAASNSVAMLETASNRIHHKGNGNTRRAACRYSDGSWIITTGLYNFANATQGCLTESGNAAKFAMPRNKVELDRVIDYRNQNFGSISDVYLNYKISAGKWVANIGN